MPDRLAIVAYAGGECRPGGFGPCVFDLAGMALPATVPLLDSHANELRAVVGQGRPVPVSGVLTVRGAVAPGTAGDRVSELLAAGVKLQASVGVEVLAPPVIYAPGKSVAVNGRTLTAGPFGLAVFGRTRLAEVSVVAAAGDPATSVVTATGEVMSAAATPAEPVILTPAPPPAPPAPNPPPPPADPVQAERQRVGEVMRLTAGHAELQASAVSDGWSIEDTRRAMLHRVRESRPVPPPAGGATAADIGPRHLAAAVLCRAGHAAAAEAAYGPQVMTQLGRLRAATLPDLAAAALRMDGREVPADRSDLIRAAVSNGTFPTALGEAARVTLEAAYKDQSVTWRAWCGVRPAADFRDHKTARPTFMVDLVQLPPGGEFKHGTYGAADGIVWRVDTFGRVLKIDRRTIVNDDLGAFAEVLPAMSRAAARTLANLVYSTLLLNPGAFFAAGSGNLLAGAGSALSVPSLAAARTAMRVQRDAAGHALDLSPVTLLVPPELETPARQLLASEALSRDGSSDQQPTANPFSGTLALAVEPRLSNPAFTGSSATAWYLFAGPADVPGVVGFLDGNQTPRTESFGFDHDVDTLAAAYRVYHDFGFALGERKAAVKSAGA